MYIQKNNQSTSKTYFLTPYRFVNAILKRMSVPIVPKKIRMECFFAKKVLDRLHDAGYDDQDITQMIEYIVQGIQTQAAPRDLRYVYGVINSFLDRGVTRETYGNIQDISQIIPPKEGDE